MKKTIEIGYLVALVNADLGVSPHAAITMRRRRMTRSPMRKRERTTRKKVTRTNIMNHQVEEGDLQTEHIEIVVVQMVSKDCGDQLDI